MKFIIASAQIYYPGLLGMHVDIDEDLHPSWFPMLMSLVLAYMLIFKLPFILTGKRRMQLCPAPLQERFASLSLFSTAAWKIIRSWLPAEAEQFIKFVDAKSITQFVRPDQLSIAMGGTVSKGDWAN